MTKGNARHTAILASIGAGQRVGYATAKARGYASGPKPAADRKANEQDRSGEARRD